MLVYLAILVLLSGVSSRTIANEVDHTDHHDRQARQACFDRVDPRKGVSDCPNMAAYCKNPKYQQVMWEQCPVTCNKCPGLLPNQ